MSILRTSYFFLYNTFPDSHKVLGSSKTPLELLEISTFSVYLPSSFSRHPIIDGMFSFQVDSRGGIFTNRPSYLLEIPKGAIAEGEMVTVQTGFITSPGNDRYQFPDGYSVVSSIVWFCTGHDKHFQKEIAIELQHCAQYSSNLTVLKAKCSGTASGEFKFEPVGNVVSQNSIYGTFRTTHFCLFCLATTANDETAKKVCVVPIEGPYFEQKKEIIFCVCYYLDTCLRVSSSQY